MSTLSDLKIGSKLFANYGAMYPTKDLVVVDFQGDFVIALDQDGDRIFVQFDNIKEYGTTSVNGSPIGVFLLPEIVH